jgi:hypothetical protein
LGGLVILSACGGLAHFSGLSGLGHVKLLGKLSQIYTAKAKGGDTLCIVRKNERVAMARNGTTFGHSFGLFPGRGNFWLNRLNKRRRIYVRIEEI